MEHELKIGDKVVCLTDMYSPVLSKGAVGEIDEVPANLTYDWIVSFSGNRLFQFRNEQIRLATEEEVAADAADPDLDG